MNNLSTLGSQRGFQEKIAIQKLQEARLETVLNAYDSTTTMRAHMKANGYECLPKNRYEDLVIVMTPNQIESNIHSA